MAIDPCFHQGASETNKSANRFLADHMNRRRLETSHSFWPSVAPAACGIVWVYIATRTEAYWRGRGS
jgi:hypothetical protein